ncbi:MAG: FtsQ-type POTRA domain-containing protein [Treponema sp.]|nr:FtsQ-type POTRA domain-containing protein [Treponema sp.]MCI6890477.1 FtsQ-type POTRA domain-containing protein [Treponema sp.]MCI7565770.1 FtsQ-type POTRA domain-containing protein [Treponema sp.]
MRVLVSDEYLDKDYFLEDDLSINEEEDKSEKKIKVIKILFCVLCLLLIGELVVYKYVMPCFSSPKVTVSGQAAYSAEEIARMLLPMESSNWLDFDVNQAVAIISSEAGIEHVAVEKRFPDKILINLEERKPVAVTLVVENGKTSAMQIDKNGVLFPGRMNAISDTNEVPIVSGLPVEYMSKGMRIPSKYRPLIDQITKISDLPQKYFASISEICVLPKEYGNYELALIPSQSKVKVLTDRALNEDALKYMMIVLDVVNQIGTDVSEVDLRYGSVSYRKK